MLALSGFCGIIWQKILEWFIVIMVGLWGDEVNLIFLAILIQSVNMILWIHRRIALESYAIDKALKYVRSILISTVIVLFSIFYSCMLTEHGSATCKSEWSARNNPAGSWTAECCKASCDWVCWESPGTEARKCRKWCVLLFVFCCSNTNTISYYNHELKLKVIKLMLRKPSKCFSNGHVNLTTWVSEGQQQIVQKVWEIR